MVSIANQIFRLVLDNIEGEEYFYNQSDDGKVFYWEVENPLVNINLDIQSNILPNA